MPGQLGFVGVLEITADVDTEGGVAGEGAKTARHVAESLLHGDADDPAQQPVPKSLRGRHLAGELTAGTESRTENDVGLAVDDRCDERGQVGGTKPSTGAHAADD